MKLDAIGSVAGLLGTALIAMKFSPFVAFVCYSVSNVAWTIWAVKNKSSSWLIAMNVGYGIIGIIGLYNWS